MLKLRLGGMLSIASIFMLHLSTSHLVDDTGGRIYEKGIRVNVPGCGKKRNIVKPEGSRDESVEVGYVLLRVFDSTSLSPVRGAEVSVNGSAVALSSEEGTVFFSLPPGEYRVKVTAGHFAPYFFKIRVSKDELSRFDVNLAPYRFSASINTAWGGEVKDKSTGVRLIFQGGGLKKKAGGSLYFGEASVQIAYLDPQREFQLFGFPGNFVGVMSNGERVLLETFGPINVRITTQSGEELDLPHGVTAYVEFPVPDYLRNLVPSSVPLWSLDENSGEWIFEGWLTKRVGEDGREVLAGSVAHFSWWNPDIPSETTCVQGIVKDHRGEPMSGVQVWSEGIDYTGADFTGTTRKTGSDGRFFVFVRKGGKAKLIANINGVKRILKEVQTSTNYPSYYLKDWLNNPSSAWEICPSTGEISINVLKIVLRWGKKFCDLDIHVTGPRASGGRFHVATKVWGQVSTSPYAEIEGDDYPEMAYIDPTVPGVYRVSVFHNNPNSTSCGRLLKDAGALVQVWYRGRVIFTTSPPPHGGGDLWKVLDITISGDGSFGIAEIKQIIDGDYCMPYHPDSSYESPCPQNHPPSISAIVPPVVDGASAVYIPYSVSDPDGDVVFIRVFQSEGGGEFFQGDGFITWRTPDVSSAKTVLLTIRAYDRKGGVSSLEYSVVITPPSILRVWETTEGFGGSVFADAEVLSSELYTIGDQWWNDFLVRISSHGSIVSKRAFGRIFDVAVGSDGVYVAYDLGGGVFGLAKFSLDLGETMWEVALTTSGRYFAKLHAVSGGVFVVFSTVSNYIMRKYSSGGSVVWEVSSTRAGSFSRCHDRCVKVNPTNGDIYISIFEDFTSGTDQQRILRLSPSGGIISVRLFYDWSPVVVLPYGSNVFVVRYWTLVEKYNENLTSLLGSLNILAYPELADFWISELHYRAGHIYGVGGRSFYDHDMRFVREAMSLIRLDDNLNLIYGKVLWISKDSDSERQFGSVMDGNHLYVVGGYKKGDLFFPIAVKYKVN